MIEDNFLLKKLCNDYSVTAFTDIQRKAIPELSSLLQKTEQNGLLILAPTGSGKTLSFLIPILNAISLTGCPGYAMIVLPSKELAIQVFSVTQTFADKMGFISGLLIGGMESTKNTQMLTTRTPPHILVTTPGRIAHFVNINLKDVTEWYLSRVQCCVFDEFDRHFSDKLLRAEAHGLMDKLSNDTITFVFASASTDDAVEQLVKGRIPKLVTVGSANQLTPKVHHQAFLAPNHSKHLVLIGTIMKLLKTEQRAIVFTPTCEMAELIAAVLVKLQYTAVSLHSALETRRRVASLQKFRSFAHRILVTTDLGARGLDIPGIDAIFNMGLPQEPADFLHRLGRAGRSSVNLVSCYSVLSPGEDLERSSVLPCDVNRYKNEFLAESRKIIRSFKSAQFLTLGDKFQNKLKKRKFLRATRRTADGRTYDEL